ncbi:hypothetical protein [Clostridium aminobutyricum]|uniref:Uncharacterized protein n=1 Tax=Clostridium aminobutyricum TaxID=33953 RepID=A0A939D6M7_CLOAM|nr:hypothetical protein [Clostridium aminobutyricum]MBN7772041.1 hypothetical protein [Clostridium aminobutyricum]
MDLLWLISKCALIGIIWAALLVPVIFNNGGAIKYLLTVALLTGLCFFFKGYTAIINTMTLIALVGLVIAFITSMAVFDKESKIKSKVIAFSCIIAGVSYLVTILFFNSVHIL